MRSIFIIAGLASLALSGCVTIVAREQPAQQAVYYRQAPAPVVNGLPQGCQRTIYGTHCNQADGYILQAPQVPGRTAQPGAGQPTCPYGGTLRTVNGQLLCVR